MSADSQAVDFSKPDVQVDESPSESGSENAPAPPVLVHFLEDGFTAFSQVWYRGQELEITPEMRESTIDRAGKTWIDMDDSEQFERFERVMFRLGPWPGKPWADQQAEAAEKARDRRPIAKSLFDYS